MKTYPHLADAIANTLEKLRKDRKMSKSSLADFSDIERSFLRGISKGTRKPTVNTMFCICEALGINPLDFFKQVIEKIEEYKKEAARTHQIDKK